MTKQKFYVVWKGRKPGIYRTWDECKAQVDGFEKPVFKSYSSLQQAQEAFKLPPPRPQPKQNSPSSHQLAARPNQVALSVDAACSGNPGVMEYRGVWIHNNTQEFISKKYPYGTNNIGEFLAIVHALALMEQSNKYYPLYTDSLIAMKWVKIGTCKTKLEVNQQSEPLHELIHRAETWLKLPHNRKKWDIRKWETKAWGEIPADFGRK